MTLSQFGEDHPWMCIWFCEMADYELEHGTYEQGAIYSSQAAEIWLKYDEKSRAANSFYTQGRMSKMAGNSLDAMQALSKAIHYGERDTRKYSVREIDKVIERPNGNRGVHLSSAPLDTHTAKEALTLLTQNLAEMPTDSKEDQKTHTNLTKLIEKLTPLVAPDGGESIYRARLKTAVKADDPASRLQSLKDLCTCLLAKDDHQAVSDLLYAEIARRAQPGDIEIHFETFHFQRNLLRRGIPQIAEATYKYTQRTLEKMRALSPKDPRYIRGLNQVIKELIAKRQLTYAYDLIEQVRRIAASLDGNHKEMDEVLGEFASYERFFTEASEH